MKHEAEIKELLVKNAIHLIAQGGFESATTKELTHCSGSLEEPSEKGSLFSGAPAFFERSAA